MKTYFKMKRNYPSWFQPFQMSLTVGLPVRSVTCLMGYSFQPTNPINFSLWKICLEKLYFYVMLQLGAPLPWQVNVSTKHAFWQPRQAGDPQWFSQGSVRLGTERAVPCRHFRHCIWWLRGIIKSPPCTEYMTAFSPVCAHALPVLMPKAWSLSSRDSEYMLIHWFPWLHYVFACWHTWCKRVRTAIGGDVTKENLKVCILILGGDFNYPVSTEK
jgi:hypothetical protein